MTNDEKTHRGFDVEERTAGFGEAVLRFARTIPRH